MGCGCSQTAAPSTFSSKRQTMMQREEVVFEVHSPDGDIRELVDGDEAEALSSLVGGQLRRRIKTTEVPAGYEVQLNGEPLHEPFTTAVAAVTFQRGHAGATVHLVELAPALVPA